MTLSIISTLHRSLTLKTMSLSMTRSPDWTRWNSRGSVSNRLSFSVACLCSLTFPFLLLTFFTFRKHNFTVDVLDKVKFTPVEYEANKSWLLFYREEQNCLKIIQHISEHNFKLFFPLFLGILHLWSMHGLNFSQSKLQTLQNITKLALSNKTKCCMFLPR
jgi:hypothetical protein